MSHQAVFDPFKSSLHDIVTALDDGSLTSSTLVEAYLKRIEEDNINGLGLRAVLEVAPTDKLLKIARILDKERHGGTKRGILHGVPVLLKDSIVVSEDQFGLQSTAGSIALIGAKTSHNAELVTNLLQAGAIIIGKANMTIFSNCVGPDMSGWSPRGGQIKNIHNPELHPGGSSTGSAVGLAMGMCAAAIGEETSGSIMSPAKMVGIYGLKPTQGVVPNAGNILASVRQDCFGPFGKSVWDLAAVLTALSGSTTDYTQYLTPDVKTVNPLRLGISRTNFNHTPIESVSDSEKALARETETLLDSAVQLLGQTAGLGIFDCPAFWGLHRKGAIPGWDQDGKWTGNADTLLVAHDMAPALEAHMSSTTGNDIRNMEDLVRWNNGNPSKELAFRSDMIQRPDRQEFFDFAVEATRRDKKEYQENLDYVKNLRASIIETMDKDGVDAVIFGGGSFQGIWAAAFAAGTFLPIASVPFGATSDRGRYNLFVIARGNDEKTLLRVLAAMEKVFPPIALPSGKVPEAEVDVSNM